MTPEQFEQINRTIADSIEKNVNGKIRAIDSKIDTYIREDLAYNKQVGEDTREWRKGADDKLSIVASVQGFGKVMGYLIVTMIGIGGAVAVFMGLVKWIRGN